MRWLVWARGGCGWAVVWFVWLYVDISATQKKKMLRDIFCVFRLLANYTQLDVSFQIHYVA